LVKQCFDCSPFRVLAEKLEPAVWEKVEELIWNPAVSEKIIEKAKALHTQRTQISESKRHKDKIHALKGQIDVLAERLAVLPKSVSPEPVFRQMEKLEALKVDEEARLRQSECESGSQAMPASLSSYRALLAGLNRMHTQDSAHIAREKIIHTLVHGIKIVPDGYELELRVGRDFVERGLAHAGPRPFSEPGKILPFHGSNSLQNGGP
jgi:predicted DNA-binding protein (UPF0251 family)